MPGAHKPQAAPLQDAYGDGLPGWPSAAVSAAAAMQADPHANFAATSAPPGNEIYEMSSAAAAAAAAAGAAAAAAAYRRSPPRMRAPPSLGLRTVASDVFAPRQDSIAKLRASLDGALAESATAREASRRAEHEATAELGRLGQLLESYSYERVLDRGFALVRDKAGAPVTRAADLKEGERLSLRFADGERGATADSEAPSPQPQPKRKTKTPADQGTLI